MRSEPAGGRVDATASSPREAANRLRGYGVALSMVLVHSNLWISLGAASLAVTTMALLDLPLDSIPASLTFAATMVVYGTNRLADLDVDEQNVPRRAAFTRAYGRPLFAAGVLLYLVAMAVAVGWGAPYAELLWLPPVVGVVYSLRAVKRRLLLKNVLVGVGWAMVPLGVGVYFDVVLRPGVLVIAGVTAAMLTIAAMVFDVKDIRGDRAAGVRTVPNQYGVPRTRRLAGAGSLAVAAGIVVLLVATVVPPTYLVLLVSPLYVVTYSALAATDRTTLFYGFVVDGEHLVLALAALAVT